MSKKQSTGLLLAAIIFIVGGIISVITNAASSAMMNKSTSTSNNSIMSMMEDELEYADIPTSEDFVAIVPIVGTIQESTGSMSDVNTAYDHDYLMGYVDALIDNEHNKGIVLELNTPGGTVYESDELYLKLMEYKEKTGRPIWAYMQGMCCSGGVYIASSSDEQYANRNTTTGSIGVIMSTYDLSGLYEKLGIKEVNITSGKNKAMGSAGSAMTKEQKDIYKSIVIECFDQFVGIVAKGRNLPVEDVIKIADGRILSANQALGHGLIDGIKGEEEFYEYVEAQSGTDEFYRPEGSADIFASLFGMMADTKEKSEAEVLVELMDRLGSGVPMYYAEPVGK